MESSLIKNRKMTTEICYNFGLTKNIPIDTRFLVSSLDNLDIEVPLNVRHNGLIFFLVTAVINDGTDDLTYGIFYCFEDDLTKPIPLHESILKYIIHEISIVGEDYSQALILLNKTFSKNGNIITIKELGVTFIHSDGVWKYFAGDYIVSTDEVFLTLPLPLRQAKAVAKIGGISKIVNLDGTLSEIVITTDVLPTEIEDSRYYNVDGVLYFGFGGKVYKLTNKLYVQKVDLVVGKTLITHNFKSTYISGFLRINSIIEEYNNIIIEAPIQIVDENSINISSKVPINCNLVLISFN